MVNTTVSRYERVESEVVVSLQGFLRMIGGSFDLSNMRGLPETIRLTMQPEGKQ